MSKAKLKQYLRKVKKSLLLNNSRQQTKSIMNILKQNIEHYFEEHPNATFEDFENHFGSPETLLPDIFEMEFSNDPSGSLSSLSHKKLHFQLVMFGVILCVLFCVAFLLKEYADFKRNQTSSIRIEIITDELD